MKLYAVRTAEGKYLSSRRKSPQRTPRLWMKPAYAVRMASWRNQLHPTLPGTGPAAVVVTFELVEVDE